MMKNITRLGFIGVLMSGSMQALMLPPAYGKTQFIIGAQEHDLRKQPVPVVRKPESKEASSVCVYFSPDDDVRTLLLELIAREKNSIAIAAFMITDKKVAQALIDAHLRGVLVELVTDSGCIKSESGKIGLLQERQIPIYVYTGVVAKPTMSNIMHNKFIIFGNNNGLPLVWTGSFNFTQSAHEHNQENVVVIQDPRIVERYQQQFELLKNRSGKMPNAKRSLSVVPTSK